MERNNEGEEEKIFRKEKRRSEIGKRSEEGKEKGRSDWWRREECLDGGREDTRKMRTEKRRETVEKINKIEKSKKKCDLGVEKKNMSKGQWVFQTPPQKKKQQQGSTKQTGEEDSFASQRSLKCFFFFFLIVRVSRCNHSLSYLLTNKQTKNQIIVAFGLSSTFPLSQGEIRILI